MPKLSKLINQIESQAPLNLQESWDNSGLQIGSRKKEIKKVLTTLDIDEAVVDEAIRENCDLILSHHPLLFRSLKRIDFDTAKGKLLEKLIKNDIAVYSSHTSLDKAAEGLNFFIASLLGLKNIKPLLVDDINSKYYKLVVYIPEENQEELIKLYDELGLGKIGDNYESCSFRTNGTGSFKPVREANPTIGELNQLEEVKEAKVETIIPKKQIHSVLEKIKRFHPYEEMAYDLFPIEFPDLKVREGLGCTGKLKPALAPEVFIEKIKETLDLEHLREAGPRPKQVKKVAICTGAGSDMILKAKSKKVQAYITGDLKYHEAQLAEEEKLWVIDAGHFGTEKKVTELLKKMLEGLELEVITSSENKDYIRMI